MDEKVTTSPFPIAIQFDDSKTQLRIKPGH